MLAICLVIKNFLAHCATVVRVYCPPPICTAHYTLNTVCHLLLSPEPNRDINLRQVASALSESEGDRLLRGGILQVLHTGCQGCSLIQGKIQNELQNEAFKRNMGVDNTQKNNRSK